MDTPSLAVVIVSWNVSNLLDQCLTSLRSDLKNAQIRSSVWVLDNASTDETPGRIRIEHPWVKLIQSEENLGFVEGNNRVMQRLLDGNDTPTYIWLLNPDTVVHPHAVERLIGFMESYPKAGLAGPRLLNTDGSLQMCAFRFPGVIQPLFDLDLMPERFYYSRFNGRYPRGWFDQEVPFRIDHPLGAAMFVRIKAIQDVGLLDPQFFMYCEEIDWAWRMKNAGWQVWLVPEAEVTHIGGASTGQVIPQTTRYLWQSRAKLYKKHHCPIVNHIVGYIVRHVFERRLAESDESLWSETYRSILKSWNQR
jgi:hypothetical protein